MLGKIFLVDLTTATIENIDALTPQLTLLGRIAEANGARLMLCSVIEPPPVNESRIAVEDRVLKIRKQKAEFFLQQLVHQTSTDSELEHVVMVGKAFIAISQLVMTRQIRLVVSFAAHGIEHPVNSRLMHLVRKCPSTVWLWSDIANRSKRSGPLHVVVAIDRDIFPGSGTADDMANRLLNAALIAAGHAEAHITLVHAWSPYGLDVLNDCAIALEPKMMRDYIDGQRFAQTLWLDERHAGLREFIAEHPNGATITTARELLDGAPAEVIPDWLESHDADLLVLGTIGTGAVPGQLIGDTAETLLVRTRMPVLTVKPADFRSPVVVPQSLPRDHSAIDQGSHAAAHAAALATRSLRSRNPMR
jgi:universal stress protein E